MTAEFGAVIARTSVEGNLGVEMRWQRNVPDTPVPRPRRPGDEPGAALAAAGSVTGEELGRASVSPGSRRRPAHTSSSPAPNA